MSPMFDFSCSCGYEITEMDSMLNQRVKRCPNCKKKSLVRLIGAGAGVIFSSGLKDKSGEAIWWPKNEKSYFDPGLNRAFNSPQEKKRFMDENNIISAGAMDSDKHKLKKKLEKYQHEEKEKACRKATQLTAT